MRLNNIYEFLKIDNILRIKYREDINFLRAIAVLSVIFYHAKINLFSGGWLGVDIFFVISGYLISNIIFAELNNGQFSFQEFYKRRARRILPALFFILIFLIPFGYNYLNPKALYEYNKSSIATLYFFANFHFKNLDFYNAEPSKYMPLLHTWSLSIEEQFYILFPIFLFFLYNYLKNNLVIVLFFLTTFSFLINIFETSTDKFYLLQFRAWELLLGVLLMFVNQKFEIKYSKYFGYPLIIFSIVYFDDNWLIDIEPKAIILLGTSLVMLHKQKNNYYFFEKINIFKNIGKSSYSAYLLHQPVFVFYLLINNLDQKLGPIDYEYNDIETSEKFWLILLTISLSLIVYKYIEEPFIKQFLKLKFLLIPFLLINLSFLYFQNNRYEETAIPNKVYFYYEERESLETYDKDKHCRNNSISEICEFRLPSSTGTVIGVGDSTLNFIGENLKTQFSKLKLDYIHISSCWYLVEFQVPNNCLNKDSIEYDNYLRDIKNSTIIYTSNYPRLINDNSDINNQLKQKLYETLVMLSKNNKVILVYPIPSFNQHVPLMYIDKKVDWSENVFYDMNLFEEYSSNVNKILDSLDSENIYRVFPAEIFCDTYIKDSCVAKYQDKLFYSDAYHLSPEGSLLLVDEIIKKILEETS